MAWDVLCLPREASVDLRLAIHEGGRLNFPVPGHSPGVALSLRYGVGIRVDTLDTLAAQRGRREMAKGTVKTELRFVTAEDLRSQLAEYEARFGVPSDRLADAFRRDGQLEETQEFLDWSALYSAYRAATTSSKRTRPSRRRAP
jgi:hypothetical protein